MGHNSPGGPSYRTTRRLKMMAFDKLPPLAREALANAAFDYVPQPILTKFRRGRYGPNGEKVARWVKIWDRYRMQILQRQESG